MQPTPVIARMAPPLDAPRIERPPLLRALLAAQKRPVALVVAGPGYGKTQSMALLWRHWPARRVWLDLDPLDTEVENLLPVLLQTMAAARVTPPGQAVPQSFLQDPEQAMDDALGWISAALTGSGDSVLFLDDVQHIQPGSSGLRFLERLIGYLPPRAHVVMASRTPPPLPWERWRVQGRSVEIGADQLRMDAGEISRLFATVYGIALSREAAVELEHGTAGWPAALLLLQYNLQSRTEAGVLERLRRAAAPGLGIYEYLLSEVLAGLPPDLESFLMASSVLPTLEPVLCDRLLERADSAALLDRLHHSGLFTYRSPVPRPQYTYHPLLREVLRLRLSSRDPAAGQRLAAGAAAAYEERGELMVALDCWLEAGRHPEAVRLLLYILETQAFPRLRTLAQWTRRFPPVLLESDPLLLVCRGYIEVRRAQHELAVRLGERALNLARQSGDRPLLARVLAAGADFALLAATDPEREAAVLQELESILPTGDAYADTRARLAITLHRSPDDPMELANMLEQVYSQFAALGRRAEQTYTLLQMTGYLMQAGRWRAATDALQQLLALTSEQVDTNAHVNAMIGLAINHRLQGDLAAAERIGMAALAAAQEKGFIELLWPLLFLLCRIDAETGRLGAAWEMVTRIETLPVRHLPQSRVELHHLRAQLYLAGGDPAAAEREVETARQLVGGNSHTGVEWMGAITAMARGDWRRAVDILRQSLLIIPPGRVYDRWRNNLGLAYAGLRAPGCLSEVEFVAALQAVARLGESEGYTLIPRQSEMETAVFTACLARGIHSPYVRAGLRRLGQAAKAPEPAGGLSPRELEVMQLLVQGLTNREIAQRLGIGEVTVKTHNKRIFEKLGVRNRTELVARVLSGGSPASS